MISSDESSELSSDTSDDDRLPERNLESSGANAGLDLDETLPDLSGGDLGVDLDNNSLSSASPEEDNRLNRSSNPSPEVDNGLNLYSNTDIDMTENDLDLGENEVVSRSPVFLDFDPCGYDTDLHGHFLPSSPQDSENSPDNVHDQDNRNP